VAPERHLIEPWLMSLPVGALDEAREDHFACGFFFAKDDTCVIAGAVVGDREPLLLSFRRIPEAPLFT